MRTVGGGEHLAQEYVQPVSVENSELFKQFGAVARGGEVAACQRFAALGSDMGCSLEIILLQTEYQCISLK